MRYVAFFAAAAVSLSFIAWLDWWIDPFGDRYQSGITATALARPKPCFIAWEVVGERTWPEFKVDLARRRDARVVVVGTSRVAKLAAWPGERGFVNVGVPGTGSESLSSLFGELHSHDHRKLVIYLGTDAFWFGHGWHKRVSFSPSYVRNLKYLLSTETLTQTLRVLRNAPGAIAHPGSLRTWEVDRAPAGCVVDRGSSVVRGGSNAWGPDGTLYFQYEMLERPSPQGGLLVNLYHFFYIGEKLDPDRLDALDDALGQAQRYGWTVIGFSPPIDPAGIHQLATDPTTSGLWLDFRRRMPGVFARHGFRWLDLTDVASVPCDPKAFSLRDGGHPDIPCSQAVRRKLDAVAGLPSRSAAPGG